MALRRVSTLVLYLLLALPCACDRDTSHTDANRPVAPQPPAMPLADLVGHWRVTTVEGGSEMPADFIDDLKSSTLTLHDDRTFRAKSNAYGGYGGSWDASGATLTLTTNPEEGKVLPRTSTLAIEDNRLAKRSDLLSTIYERVPVEAMVPQFRLTADEFMTELKRDPSVFQSKYVGKMIELEGVVNKVITTFGQESYVLVYGPPVAGAPEPDVMQGVACFTIEKEPYAHLAYGQTIKIRGEAAQIADVPQLLEAEVIQSGPATAVTMSADELARDYKDDPVLTIANNSAGRFTGKTLILTGSVLSVQAETGSAGELILGTSEASVHCLFGSEKEIITPLQSLKSGEIVRLVGEFDLVPAKEKHPTVIQCRLLSSK